VARWLLTECAALLTFDRPLKRNPFERLILLHPLKKGLGAR
jgi:hypothetical protein